MAKEVRKTFYDRDFVPKNVEEFYNSGWKNYTLHYIKKYSLKDVTHTPEDLFQDMLLQMIHVNFFDRYDSERSGFTGYLSTFIRNFMTRPYHAETDQKYSAINDTVSLQELNGDVDTYEKGVVDANIVPDMDSEFVTPMCLIQSLESDLQEIKTNSKVVYNGVEIQRSPYTVYKLLMAGYEVKEIAEMFGTSKQFVYTLRDKIREIAGSYA